MKRDLNYIAALENAVSKQYGEIATLNPKSLWTPDKEQDYLEQVREAVKKEAAAEQSQERVDLGGVFIAKKLLTKNVERRCAYCQNYSFNRDNEVYLTKYGSCHVCYIKHIEGRK